MKYGIRLLVVKLLPLKTFRLLQTLVLYISVTISIFKKDFFKDFDFTNEIKKFVTAINIQGKKFITEYLNELEKTTLAEDEQLTLLKIAFVVIYADEKVEYSEVKFFKNIRSRLSVTDETIKQRFEDIPDLDIFLAQDLINNFSLEKITEEYFNSVSLPQFNIGDFKV